MSNTGIDHISNEAIELAAVWLSEFKPGEGPQPVIQEIKTRFGISSEEACEAIRRADLKRLNRRAHA